MLERPHDCERLAPRAQAVRLELPVSMGATVTSKKFEQRPGRDILAAVSNLGGKIDTFEEITRLRTPESRHGCFRLVLMDGLIVKGRRF